MTERSAAHSRFAAFGRADNERRAPVEDDTTDYEHRHFVNLLAAVFLLAFGVAVVWTIKSMQDYEAQRACLDGGKLECRKLDVPAHPGVRAPRSSFVSR